ncbi:MAG: PKD domain-containing protein, partial [Methanomicrobiales archaeon]|nr:PKD domain-containing protein [Methanomicrobiales archaeon]
MVKRILSLVVLFVVVAAVPAAGAGDEYPGIDGDATYRLLSSGFIPNAGQYDPAVEYILQHQGTTIFFTRDGLVLTHTPENASTDVIRQSFAGASSDTHLSASGRREGVVNYYVGNDSSKWLSDIPVYSEVIYEDLYPGIDLVYTEKDGRLKREFSVSPGADPSQIELLYEGESEPHVDEDGVLRFTSPAGEMLESPLVCWQVIGGERVDRAAEYVVDGGSVRIRVEEYDAGHGLIIDPELVYSSYLGGGDWDYGTALAGDGSGGVWVTGITYSYNFPTLNAYQNRYGGYYDVFVSHFSSSGILLSSTYLGGSGKDLVSSFGGLYRHSLVGDGSGGVWVTGGTTSSDFPVRNAYQSSFGGGADAFVAHFSSSGILLSSTYLGGDDGDEGLTLAGDGSGGVWVMGCTYSSNFPVLNAPQSDHGGNRGIFVAHFSPSGDLLSSTYLSGKGYDQGADLVGDGAGGVWASGYTMSTDFPVLNAYQGDMRGHQDIFVAHFSPSGDLLSSTYLGGGDYDYPYAFTSDGTGGVWIAGDTWSTDFPVRNEYQSNLKGYRDTFVSHFSSSGDLLSSTYLGGESFDADETDIGYALAGDGEGGVWVAGSASSSDFPVKNAYQSTYGGNWDAFVSHFSSSGTLLSSTYLGGASSDWGIALAGDDAGGVWVTGYTTSPDFPILNAPQSSFWGDNTGVFISHFSSSGALLSSTRTGGYNPNALTGDGTGGIWVTGDTSTCGDFLITEGAYQSKYGGGSYDAIIAKFIESGIPQQAHKLTVPYIHQVYDTPTGFNGEDACSETSAVMVLAYHGRLAPDPVVCENKWVYGGMDESLAPTRISVYGKHVCEEYTYDGTAFSESYTGTTHLGRTAAGAGAWGWIENAVSGGTERPEAVTEYLELHDCDAEFIRSPSSYEASVIIRENIDKGRPVIARTCPDGATEHYVVIVGYSQDSGGTSYFVNDPYGIEPYDDTIPVQHLDQLVRYTYGQMRLGWSSGGLITVHPIQNIQPEKIEEVQKTTISWDKEGSSVFADPLALSGSIGDMIAGEEDGDNYIRLRFEASGYIKNPSAVIVDKAGNPVSVPASNLKVEKTDDNNVIVYWDGKSGENTVNQANNPYNISVTAEDKAGATVTSEEARVWVGRPVLLVHGVTGEAENVETRLVYKELSKEYYVEAVEYSPGPKNAFGSIPNYADCLDSEIDRIKSETGAKKVDIVAHSMGGLISRWRIEKIPSGDADVGKLIMMGTPNHGAVLAEILMAGVTFFESSMSYPDFAVNQMRPGKDFLKELNGGNSHWYDVYLYKYGLGKQDEIAENTQYYVLAGAYHLTDYELMPLHKVGELLKKGVLFDRYRGFGDFIVPYYSAMIANPKATIYDMHYKHGEMWDKRDYYDKVVEILTKPDGDTTLYSGALLYSDGGGEVYQSVLGHFTSTGEQNPLLTSLLASIDVTINPEEKYHSEFEVNADTDSLSCFAFWESGRMEISLTDPDGNLAASETDETMSLLSVSSPQSGIWNLSVSPGDIPASGTDLSLKIYITHPLYATVVDDMDTYAPGSPVPISVYAGTIDLPATGGTATCTVKTPDGETVTLDLYDDGAHDDEYPDDGIYGNTFTDTGTIGIYSVDISVSVPYGSEVVERKIEKTITINSYPDLVIRSGDLSASNTTPDAGDIITFSTTVENIGDARATNASVIILDLTENTPDIIAETVFDLGVGESVTIESEWKAEPGTHEITAQISPFAEFMESDYTNNADSITITTNDYPVEIVSENVTFTGTEPAEISIWLTNQTDPGYYITTLLYNDTIISPSEITSDDLDIDILLDEGGELKFNATATERQKGLLHIGNISIQRAGEGDTGTNTTIIVQAYDSGGKPRGLFMIDRFVYLFPVHPEANFTSNIRSGEFPLTVKFTDQSTGEEITGRYWGFGDGTLSTDTDPVHTYLKDGTYDVSLTVVNTAGPSVVTKSQHITV